MHSLDLAGIVDPVSVAEFLDEYFGLRPLYSSGPAKRLGTVMPGDLARKVERVLEAPVRADLQVVSEGFAPRAEEHDLMILQLEGDNRRAVYVPGGTEIAWEGVLGPGDALYIPRGWTHAAEIDGQSCSILNLTIENPRGTDILRWLATMLEQNEVLNKDVPRFAGPQGQASYVQELRQAVDQIMRAPGLMERYRRHLNQTAPPPAEDLGRPWTSATPQGSLITTAASRPLEIRHFPPAQIGFIFNGKRYEFPKETAPVLHYLQDHDPVTVKCLYEFFASEFEPQELGELLAALSASGAIVVREPGME